MSTTLSASALAVRFGARTLVTGLDLSLTDGDVVALVGTNGSGKSTVMRTLVGEIPVESGHVRLSPAHATVAWLPQVTPDPSEDLLAYARRRTGVAAADAELTAASEALASGQSAPGADEAGDVEERYARALEHWLSLGAADLEQRLPAVAARVGLHVDPFRALGSLSGGQAARACLVAVLLSRHDVLLLDEPTNDLDASGLAVMTEFVREHRGPVLVASHDRRFLDDVATRVVELDLHQQRVTHHAGGYSDYVAGRELSRRQAREAYQDYAASRDRLAGQARQRDEWAARGRRALSRGDEPDKHEREKRRARADRQQAKAARIGRAIDRLEAVEQPRKEWELRYTINSAPGSAEVVASLDDVVVGRGDFSLGPVKADLVRGDRIAVTGDNGSGKSTLLGVLIGSLAPDGGRRSLGARVRIGWMDQQRSVLDDDRTVQQVVAEAVGEADGSAVRTLLAKFGLGAEHIGRPARSLSMGERTRALMAVFAAREVNLLVLDEPTNHLDLPAIEQLESALAAYDGSLVVVTHDRAFLEAVGTTGEWRLTDGRLAVVHG
jgi:ATPase subunit of ABC transporter with duplicated ATPase domains